MSAIDRKTFSSIKITLEVVDLNNETSDQTARGILIILWDYYYCKFKHNLIGPFEARNFVWKKKEFQAAFPLNLNDDDCKNRGRMLSFNPYRIYFWDTRYNKY